MSTPWRRFRPVVINVVASLALFMVGAMLVGRLSPAEVTPVQEKGRITLGWQQNYPYQYVAEGSDLSRGPSGVDTELVREAFRRAGYDLDLVHRSWAESLAEVESGAIDGVSLAFKTSDRQKYATFSEPFFTLRTALFFPRNRFKVLPTTPAGLLDKLRGESLVLGYAQHYAYLPEILQMLSQPVVQATGLPAETDPESLAALVDGNADLVLADQLTGTSMVLRNGWNGQIGCLPLDLEPQQSHLMLSKESVEPEVVHAFDKAMASMAADGTRAHIVRGYFYPTMLNLLAHTFWFAEIGLLAASAAAFSGIFLARKVGANLVGAFLLAAAPAVGGGLLRDLVAGRRPVGIVADPSILLTVVFLVLFAFLAFRIVDKRNPRLSVALDEIDIDRHPLLMFFDALGLAAFTVLGVLIAMQWHCEPLWMWGPLLAAATNGGGSILRDVILQRPVAVVHSRLPYIEVSVLWGWLLSCYLIYSSSYLPYQVMNLQVGFLATMIGVVLTYVGLRLAKAQSPTYGASRQAETASEE